MSQIPKFNVGAKQPDTEWSRGLERELDLYCSKISEILNKGINLKDNFDGYIVSFTTNVTPGVATVLTHGLKRVPTALIVLEQDKAGSVYKVSKNVTQYQVASDVASMTATVIII